MVVGVKELRHIQSCGAFSSASHGEVQVVPGQLGKASRCQTQGKDPVKHLIVQCAVEGYLGNACSETRRHHTNTWEQLWSRNKPQKRHAYQPWPVAAMHLSQSGR